MAFISITRITTVTMSSLSILDPLATQSGCTPFNQILLCITLLNIACEFLFAQEWLSLVAQKFSTQVVWPRRRQSMKITGIHVLSYLYSHFAIHSCMTESSELVTAIQNIDLQGSNRVTRLCLLCISNHAMYFHTNLSDFTFKTIK